MPLPDPSTIESYGGRKEDRHPVTNPRTTLAAAEHNVIVSDLAMMTRMSPRAFFRFVAGTPPTEPTSGVVHEAQWGHALADKPVLTYDPGWYQVRWPEFVQDELGNVVATNLRWALAWHSNGPNVAHARANLLDHRTVRIHTFNVSGMSDMLFGATINLMVW